MDITITDAARATDMVSREKDKYRVISITSPGRSGIEFPDAKEVLYLKFDDVADSFRDMDGFMLATEEDCRNALDFLRQGGPCLVHCQAGISRSPAIVLGYLLSELPWEKAVNKLFQIRSCAVPNTHILKLMCKILGMEENYPAIQRHVGITRLHTSGTHFSPGPNML